MRNQISNIVFAVSFATSGVLATSALGQVCDYEDTIGCYARVTFSFEASGQPEVRDDMGTLLEFKRYLSGSGSSKPINGICYALVNTFRGKAPAVPTESRQIKYFKVMIGREDTAKASWPRLSHRYSNENTHVFYVNSGFGIAWSFPNYYFDTLERSCIQTCGGSGHKVCESGQEIRRHISGGEVRTVVTSFYFR